MRPRLLPKPDPHRDHELDRAWADCHSSPDIVADVAMTANAHRRYQWLALDEFAEDALGKDVRTEYAAWLAGRAFRNAYGPTPTALEAAPVAERPAETLESIQGLALDVCPNDHTFRTMWTRGWFFEHAQLGG